MNEFLLIFVYLPAIIILFSIGISYSTKRAFVSPIIVLLLSGFAMYRFFNESFLIWVIVYSILSILISVITVKLRIENQN